MGCIRGVEIKPRALLEDGFLLSRSNHFNSEGNPESTLHEKGGEEGATYC
jgi:hypothetical protein